MSRACSSRTHTRGRRRESGQVLVIFALALIAIVAMTGLVLDGGSTFVQRRDQQNVADAAALAAAYAYATTGSTAASTAAAQTIATDNGFANGALDTTIAVANAAGNPGWTFTVNVTRPHTNNFSGLLGMPSWNVTTTATTLSGRPNAAIGAMPIIFNQSAFDVNGAGNGAEQAYDEPPVGSSDIPLGPSAFNWTEYCNNCNADSSTVDGLIVDHLSDTTVVTLDDKISPLNAGSHTTLFDSMAAWVGGEFPVPIVDDAGNMVGFAMFHLTGAVGGDTKQIRGYFVSPFNGGSLTIVNGVEGGGDFGSYTAQLIN